MPKDFNPAFDKSFKRQEKLPVAPLVKIATNINKTTLDRNVKITYDFISKDGVTRPCSAHWINRHDQFGCVTFELVIVTDDGEIKARIPKKFKLPPDQVTEAFLKIEAAKEIQNTTDTFEGRV